MKRLLCVLLLAPFASIAASAACTQRPNVTTDDLKSLAAISPAKAHRIALDAVGGSAKSDTGVLEVNGDNCLVYRFNLKPVDGRANETVVVDAGDGSVLDRRPTSASAAEATKPR